MVIIAVSYTFLLYTSPVCFILFFLDEGTVKFEFSHQNVQYCSNIAYECRSICNGSPDRYCHMSRHIGKSTICIGEISVFVFATQYIQFLYYLNPTFPRAPKYEQR